jgi:hypothetical protein
VLTWDEVTELPPGVDLDDDSDDDTASEPDDHGDSDDDDNEGCFRS